MMSPNAPLPSLHSLPRLLLAQAHPVGDEYIVAIRESIDGLVAIDVEAGGNMASVLGLQAFMRARHILAVGAYRAGIRRDLWAAVAELAELAGWLLCDANRQFASYAINQEALTFSRLSGDRSMELFVTHNLSLQATYMRQPWRSLEFVLPVLDRGRLTPRLQAMFQLRVARAYAQMGLRRDALKALDGATGLFYEGVSDRDPPWSWWISERGFSHASGLMLGSLGDWKAAVDPIQRALAAAPEGAHRDRFLYLCAILHAQIKVAAWPDAESTAEHLIPLMDTVGSNRPLARLTATIDELGRHDRVPRRIADILCQIRESGRLPLEATSEGAH